MTMTAIADHPDTAKRSPAEPVSLAGALNDSTETPESFLAQWEANHAAFPDQFHKPGVCRYCAGPMPAPHVIQREILLFPITVCEPCVVKGLAEHADQRNEEMRSRHAAWCPPEFNQQWDAAKGNAHVHAEVMKYAFDLRRNLLIHGPTGHCKTRVVWTLLKNMADADALGRGFLFIDAYELSTKPIPAEAYQTGILVLDDIGNDARSSKYEVALLHLLKKRLEWHKPVFITTQLDGKAFVDRFFPSAEHTARAILRRLKERTDFIAA